MRLTRYIPNGGFAPAVGFGRGPWTGLEKEIGRAFESALGGLGGPLGGNQFPVDLYEDKDNTYVRADLPGVSRNDLNVEMVEGYLSVSATRKQKHGEEEETYSFSRSINVPDDVQADKVAASFEDGVLTVTLPKREETKPKKVPVTVH
ncbi:MAG: Hsp20/alpha crystallin family protein [Opitutaceae bacterium]